MNKPFFEPSADALTTWTRRLQQYWDRHIPLTRAMAVQVTPVDDKALIVTAPLACNHNDKGAGFGGSIAALQTLAGWGVVWLCCEWSAMPCTVVVAQSQIRYRRPVTGDLSAQCPFPDQSAWQEFSRRLNEKNRARITLPIELWSAGELASVMSAEYAGLRSDHTTA